MQHNLWFIIKETRSAETELSEVQGHMGAEGNDINADIKHMVAHLQRALAGLPSGETSPASQQHLLFKAVSQKEPSFSCGDLSLHSSNCSLDIKLHSTSGWHLMVTLA